jgi:DNA-binding GntR family transcriptional regulator
MARAWNLRDSSAYIREDFEVMRSIAEAAKFTPGLWLLNRFADLWFDAADAIKFAVKLPEDYVQVHHKFFDLIESGDADGACALMSTYLDRHDADLIKALQLFA